MTNQDKRQAHIARLAKLARYIGWIFLVGGSFLCIDPVRILFDGNATISVNGVPTTDFGTKLAVAAFTLMFPIIGGILAFTPTNIIQKFLS